MMKKLGIVLILACGPVWILTGKPNEASQETQQKPDTPFDPSLEEFVRNFKGGGEGVEGAGDQSPLSPEESLRHFRLAPGLALEVVASEPVIRQPLDLHFDERGRLWVVQYLQYPFPAGIKIIRYDRYLRAVFDRVPPPPPHHDRGADRITILEDTDGDGRFDSSKDFLAGLNITTSVAVGRGGVWVLNPPYLLFYPDRDRDDVPDGDPEVHLAGFGLEDTHAVANSLHWGPDGWLYGAQGSTTTAQVQGVEFLGQAIWRYHPETRRFELFAEGGGNTWSIDFDRKGRLFSGTNHGATRGVHYAQGGYYVKNFPKHGPLTNPFAFGFLPHMAHRGYQPRFAQTIVIYEGGALPGYEGHLIAGMALTNRVQASRLLPDTSTFQTVDTDPLILTDNEWFRPVDTEVGPDGAVYIADWHDIRLSHLSPRDNWYRSAGRIYRLSAPGATPLPPFDLGRLSSEELVSFLSHRNKWFREQARRLLADRRDGSIIPRLKELVEQHQGQLALEGLWALYVSGGFEETFALRQLRHPDELVRYWTIRFLGDANSVSAPLREALVEVAGREPSPEVRSQLASSCKRLPALDALPILGQLLERAEDVQDRQIPLLLWWALEDKLKTDRELVLAFLEDHPDLWRAPLFREHIAARLGRRFTAERGQSYYTFSGDYQGVYSPWKTREEEERTRVNLTTSARLLELAAEAGGLPAVLQGMNQGLEGTVLRTLPEALRRRILAPLAKVPGPASLTLALRLADYRQLPEALRTAADSSQPAQERQQLIAALVDLKVGEVVAVILAFLQEKTPEPIRLAALNQLARFEEPAIADSLLHLYRELDPALRGAVQDLLLRRPAWTRALLEAVDSGKIAPQEVAESRLAAALEHEDPRIRQLVRRHWAESSPKTSADLFQQSLIQRGQKQYNESCAYCHLASGEGMKRSLVNSRWILGPERALIRIILQGKAGEEMEMPPLGSQLDDGQIAAILTYLRQEWGHRASPVDPSVVAEIRRRTAGREQPWSEEELMKLVQSDHESTPSR